MILILNYVLFQREIPLISSACKQTLQTPDGQLAAFLVQDFLKTLGLDFSLSVFQPESGYPYTYATQDASQVLKNLNLSPGKVAWTEVGIWWMMGLISSYSI